MYGVFNDVDIRSEARFDELRTDFTHLTLDGSHEFSETLRLHALVGYSEAEHDNPIQTTLLFDRADVDGYSYDYRGNSRLPVITYGNVDVTSPATWTLSQIRLRPQSSTNEFRTASFELEWDVADAVTLKAGPQYKKFEFETESLQRSNGTLTEQEATIPANVAATPIADYSRIVAISGNLDAPAAGARRWLIPDLDRAAQLFNLYDPYVFRLGPELALSNNYFVEEEDLGGFVQADFRTEVLGRPLRGNLGVRYVQTDQTSSGFVFTSGSPVLTTVDRSYSDTLPSLNLVMEVTDSFLIRASAAKVMARPNGGGQATGLGILSPGAAVGISGANKTVTAGNPELNPYRAKAYDLAFEWYFAEDSLLSLALFQKDIGSFVQIIRSSDNFSNNTLGLPDSVALNTCGAAVPAATCLDGWQFSVPTNTDGGDVKGFEISYQQPFSFPAGVLQSLRPDPELHRRGVRDRILRAARHRQQRPAAAGDRQGRSDRPLAERLQRDSVLGERGLRRAHFGSVPRRLSDDRAGTQQQRCRRHHRNAEPGLLCDVDGDAGARYHARGAEPHRRVPGSVRGRAGRPPLVLPPPGTPVPARRPLQVLSPQRLAPGPQGPGALLLLSRD